MYTRWFRLNRILSISLAISLMTISFAFIPSPEVNKQLTDPISIQEAPEKLVTADVQTMTSNSTHIFWTISITGEFCPADGEPAIRRIPINGGTEETLYHSCSFDPYQITADESYVYFADWSDDKIKRLPVTGGTPTIVASADNLMIYRGLAVDDAYIYWGDWQGIRRAPKSGGSPQTLASDNASVKLAVDSTYVYWSMQGQSAGEIRRVDKSGGSIQTLVNNLDQPFGIAIDASYVYFTERGTGKSYRVNKDGSGLTSYVPDSISPYIAEDITVDNNNVYWLDTTGLVDGRLRRVLKTGGTIEDLALGLFGPVGIFTTATHVVWGDSSGIWRLQVSAPSISVDLSIKNMEVTQGIQCLDNTQGATNCADNSVPLIANRMTYVRVYPAVTIANTANVTARLYGTKDGNPLPGSPISPTNPKVYTKLSGAQRDIATDSFNLELPINWRSGTIKLQAEINPGNVIPETNYSNNTTSQLTITFKAAETLEIAYIPINYTFSGWTGPHTASWITMIDAEKYLRALLPYSDVVYHSWPTGAAFSEDINTKAGENNLIAELNERYMFSSNPPDQLFGWLPSGSYNNGLSDPKWDKGKGVVSQGDAIISPAVIAHEIGHNLGRRHPTCTDLLSDWPYGNTTIDIQEVGFDVFQRTTWPANSHDWMVGGNCGNGTNLKLWISPWNWTQIINDVIDYSPANSSEIGSITESIATSSTAIITIIVDEKYGELRPIWLIDSTFPPTPFVEGTTYCLKFINQSSETILQRCFDVDLYNRAWIGQTDSAVQSWRMLLPEGTTLVQLTKGQRVLDEQRMTANAPVVTVTAPNGGETWSGKQTIQWEASDADDDTLTYNVLYSRDGGSNWQSLASGVTATSLEVDTAEMGGTTNAVVRVLASDGLQTGYDISNGPFTVVSQSPEVHIISPANGSGFRPNEQIVLTGSAYDREDGQLAGENLIWEVEGLGPIGAGPEASFLAEEPGDYHVTLHATDSDAMIGEASVDIWVGAVIYLNPANKVAGVNENTMMEIFADDVENLYGLQLELSFDPAVVQVVDAYPGVPGVQIEEGDFFIPELSIQNSANNTTGVIQYAASLQSAKPGVSGSGVLALITFRGKAPGSSPVNFIQAILSDPFSVQIPAGVQGGYLIVQQDNGAVSGKVTLERRSTSDGAFVCLNQNCTTTDSGGNYLLPVLPYGQYTATVSHPSYLRSWTPVNLTQGLVTLPDLTLFAGDINQDDAIELADLNLIGQAWNAAPTSPNWNPAADITNNNLVNILDIVAVPYNWDMVAPGPWSLSGASFALTSPVSIQSQVENSTQVIVSPPSASAPGPGAEVSLDIQVQDVVDLYSYRLQIAFDPNILRVKDVDTRPSAPGVQIQPGDFLDPDNQFIAINKADNTAGTIDFAITQLYPATAKSGSGLLARITFQTIGSGSSPVDIFQARLLDDSQPDPLEIPVVIQDGLVTIGTENKLYLPLVSK